ncbi:MAG: hypothetical protein JRG84_11330 [Deltaproteobacteria bacterium]|nr:hypothetical protein [Deltaproteobacteria bacterium]
MRGLPEIETGATTRVRRWDAVVLGGALPGIVAAARLGMRGARVLVLEEAAAAQRAACLREPFCFGAMDKDAVLGACLRALRVPLIDQRRIAHAALALQVVLPNARLDVGEPALTVDEWVAWGLAKPEPARNLAGALHEAGLAERDALLDDPIVSLRGSRRPPEGGRETPEPTPRVRGLPAALDTAPDRVRRVLSAWSHALSNLGGSEPNDEARALLLGLPLSGCADTREAGVVNGVLRRRLETLYGEFRTLPDEFRLVSAGGQPGVAPDADGSSGEVWVARALILNAPRAALAGCVAQDPIPELLDTEPVAWQRLKLHWRTPRKLVPEAMAPRVVLVRDEREPLSGANLICLRSFTAEDGQVDLVASTAVHTRANAERLEDEIEALVAGLLPFVDGRLVRQHDPKPRWDNDDALADPARGAAWPHATELRLATRQPVYALERAGVAGLGSDGDLLLGWRGGDAIAAELG